MGLLTFTDRFPDATLRDHAARHASSVGDRTIPADGVALGVAAVGEVNAGRWLARCPNPDCGGAELIDPANPLVFCCECRNAGAGGQAIRAKVPKRAVVEAIDQALMMRPVPATRNWQPGESVDDLLAENHDHGIGA